jgi:uncharacterized membrane protein (UPF0182 family)
VQEWRRAALSYYVDVLWFGSLGYWDVLWKTLSLQWGIFAAFAAATFLILFGSFLALKRAHLPDLPSGHTIFIGGQPLKLQVEPVMRLIAVGLSLAIAAITGAGMMIRARDCFHPDQVRNSCVRRTKLTYTHGYGITMNPVNGFTAEGLPTLLLSNMPVQSTVRSLTGRKFDASCKLLFRVAATSSRPRSDKKPSRWLCASTLT